MKMKRVENEGRGSRDECCGGLKAEMKLRSRGWRAVKNLDADARNEDDEALRRE